MPLLKEQQPESENLQFRRGRLSKHPNYADFSPKSCLHARLDGKLDADCPRTEFHSNRSVWIFGTSPFC